jgi:carboxyl-terminal processing protease
MGIALRMGLAGAALSLLTACGGGGGGSGNANPPANPSAGNYTAGVYPARASLAGQCTAFNEKMFLRSWTNELYLWYSEVADNNPNNLTDFPTVEAYFNALKTNQTTPSGNAKDRFHFTFDTDDFIALAQGGQDIGYGAEMMLLGDGTPPRRAVVAFVEPGSPASNGGVTRGMEVVSINGVDFVNDGTQAGVNVLNAGFFPDATGQTFTFVFKPVTGPNLSVQLTSANITHQPVLIDQRIPVAGGEVGYMVFNDHIGPAEHQLFDAITRLQGVDDLILDLRYNGGGFLDLANELAFMIAGPGRTTGHVFERLVWNNKHQTLDPIANEPLSPGASFFSTAQGVPGSNLTPGTPLPTLDLPRLYVITGPNTCSASESIINALRGIGVPVVQIGSTTCGKPYGFYPQDNCGTTYFAIQFQGVNAMGDGEYPDGFAPTNQSGRSSIKLAGCSVADDFTHQFGDTAEGRLKAALDFRATGACPIASGFAPGAQLKAGQPSAVMDGKIHKSPLRENRLLRPR